MFKGSTFFFCVHTIGQFKCVLSTYTLPDAQKVTLITDFQNQTDLSTFVNNGNILIKCKNRFMIFGDNGVFRCEVQFD